jgi:hypothetical protein
MEESEVSKLQEKRARAFIMQYRWLLLPDVVLPEDLVKPRDLVEKFVRVVRSGDREALSRMVIYPLRRDAPLPPVKNALEFIGRYDEIFDANLSRIVGQSSFEKDWTVMGSRGIMLRDGLIWLEKKTGNVLAVNYRSQTEKNRIDERIEAEKRFLSPRLRNFVRPVLLGRTKDYFIRVDELGNGVYRLGLWKWGKRAGSDPDLLVRNGELEFYGSGGNRAYVFREDDRVYRYEITELAKDEDPDVFQIFENGKPIYEERVVRMEAEDR